MIDVNVVVVSKIFDYFLFVENVWEVLIMVFGCDGFIVVYIIGGDSIRFGLFYII